MHKGIFRRRKKTKVSYDVITSYDEISYGVDQMDTRLMQYTAKVDCTQHLDIRLFRPKSDQFIINYDTELDILLNTKGAKVNRKEQELSHDKCARVCLFYFEEEFFTKSYPIDRQQYI